MFAVHPFQSKAYERAIYHAGYPQELHPDNRMDIYVNDADADWDEGRIAMPGDTVASFQSFMRHTAIGNQIYKNN